MNCRSGLGLCRLIIEEARNCPHINGGGCPVLERFADDAAGNNDHLSALSPRELEVHMLLVRGKTNKMIAAQLGISVRTAEFHRANIMRKLKVKTLAELIEIGAPAAGP